MNYSIMWYRYHVLPKSHFMSSGRYWSHIQDFQTIIRRIFMNCRCRSFPVRNFKIPKSKKLDFDILKLSNSQVAKIPRYPNFTIFKSHFSYLQLISPKLFYHFFVSRFHEVHFPIYLQALFVYMLKSLSFSSGPSTLVAQSLSRPSIL